MPGKYLVVETTGLPSEQLSWFNLNARIARRGAAGRAGEFITFRFPDATTAAKGERLAGSRSRGRFPTLTEGFKAEILLLREMADRTH